MTPRVLTFALSIATAVALLPVSAGPATAATTRPAVPRNVHQAGATRTSITVRCAKTADAHRYVLIASRVKSDIFYQHLDDRRGHRIEVRSARPRMTAHHLAPTTRPYYYRVQTRNGDRQNLSDIHFGYVAPPRPGGVHLLHPSGRGLAVSWAGERAGGFTVKVARNRAMSRAARTYHVHGNITQFTPFGLHSHARYYFRVRAVNGGAHSRYSGTVGGRLAGHVSAMSMVTWNVLHTHADGTRENGNTVAPWHKRLKVVVSMLRSMNADLININEGNDFLHHSGRYRQVDSIEARFKKHYGLASADFTAAKYHPQIGNYVLYRRSMFRPLYRHEHGKSHYFDLGAKHFVMYQAFRNRRSGARFLMVSLHLSSGPNGPRANGVRTHEMRRLLADVARLQRRNRHYRYLPVIYAGDTNSFAGPNPASLDGPGDLLRAAHATDSLMAAQSRKNTKYGSVNGYTRVPSHTGKIIDHFYATPGVAFQTWRQVMHLKRGRWPAVIPSDHNPILVHAVVQH